MKIPRLIILYTLIINITISETFLIQKGISVLTTSKFDKFIKKNKNQLVFTYLPNCSHCKNVLEFLPNLAERLKPLKVEIGKYDVSSNKDFRQKSKTEVFPFLQFYINNVYLNYPFEFDEDKIFNWVSTLVNRKSNLSNIKTRKDLELAKKKDSAFIFKFPENDLTVLEMIKTFSIIYNTKIYVYQGKNLLDIEYDNDDYLFYFWRKFDDGPKSFTGQNGFNPKILQSFLEMFITPNINLMSEEQTNYILKNRKKTFFVFDNDYESDLMKMIKEIAPSYKHKIHFIRSNKTETNATTIANLLDVNTMPAVRIIEFGKNKFLKYKPENLTKEKIIEFIQKSIKNEVTQFYKQEAIPINKGFVKKIVRDNYKEIINQSNKNIFVAFVTSWCEHCKEVDTAFKDIESRFDKKIDNIIFAKANYDKNDFDMSVNSFPSLYLFKIGNKSNPIEYTMIRDWEVILDFLEKETNQKLYVKEMPEEVKKSIPENQENVEL